MTIFCNADYSIDHKVPVENITRLCGVEMFFSNQSDKFDECHPIFYLGIIIVDCCTRDFRVIFKKIFKNLFRFYRRLTS